MLAQSTTTHAVDEALAWHDGDSRATIRTLLEDCAHLQAQLAVTSACMSKGSREAGAAGVVSKPL